MIHKLFFILFSFGIISCSAYGQETYVYKSNWQTKALFGANVPITKLLQGAKTDDLLQYNDHYFYWQPISISYFFHKHWGLEFNYQIGHSQRIRKRADNFETVMRSEYSDKYYVYPKTEDVVITSSFTGVIERGYLGLIFRFETDKMYVYPKLSIGITSFCSDWGRVDLKEKNSNNEYKISYSSEERPYVYFTFAPSVSFGYKLFHRLYINADIMLSHCKTNIVFEENFLNLYTKEKTVKYFDYKKDIFSLSFGGGLIYIMRFKKSR